MSLVAVQSSEEKFKSSILELQELFSHFDKMGIEGVSGAVSAEKLGEALREAVGLSFSDSQLQDMIAAVDLNDSGDVQFNEFLKMMDQARAEHDAVLAEGREADGDADGEHDEQKESDVALREQEKLLALEADYSMTREAVKAIFQKFDTDKDGFVSHAELKAMLVEQGEKYADEEIHAMIHLVDPSNSGMISYQAFVRLLMSPED